MVLRPVLSPVLVLDLLNELLSSPGILLRMINTDAFLFDDVLG